MVIGKGQPVKGETKNSKVPDFGVAGAEILLKNSGRPLGPPWI